MAIGPARAILGLVLDSSSHVLERARVRDCMHHGIFDCDPDVPLAEAGTIMAARDVRAVAVRGHGTFMESARTWTSSAPSAAQALSNSRRRTWPQPRRLLAS